MSDAGGVEWLAGTIAAGPATMASLLAAGAGYGVTHCCGSYKPFSAGQ